MPDEVRCNMYKFDICELEFEKTGYSSQKPGTVPVLLLFHCILSSFHI